MCLKSHPAVRIHRSKLRLKRTLHLFNSPKCYYCLFSPRFSLEHKIIFQAAGVIFFSYLIQGTLRKSACVHCNVYACEIIVCVWLRKKRPLLWQLTPLCAHPLGGDKYQDTASTLAEHIRRLRIWWEAGKSVKLLSNLLQTISVWVLLTLHVRGGK